MAYLKRQAASKKLPIERKGTTYVAKAMSHYKSAIPVSIAVRDLLHLARTTREVKLMIKDKKLKINGKPVKTCMDSIKLFNIFEADKHYYLTLLPTGKMTLAYSKDKNRICKVTGKKILKGSKIQLNLHDGSNILSNEPIKINDTILLSPEGKIKDKISFSKGKKAIIISGKHAGSFGKIEDMQENNIKIAFENKEGSAVIGKDRVILHE